MEISEYHWFHREKVELYMAELYNKVGKSHCKQTAINEFSKQMFLCLLGTGLMTWSPISFGMSMGDKEENTLIFEKLSIKVLL